MKRSQAQAKNFESSLEALEKVVRELERGDLPLEESLRLFEQGVRLSRECQDRLNEAERRIEVLLQDGDGRPLLSALDEEGDDLSLTERTAGTERDESVF